MLFHTVIYAVFLPTVWLVYMLVGAACRCAAQNFVLLVASYFFLRLVGLAFPRLIALSSLVDYIVGLSLNLTSENRNRRLILARESAGLSTSNPWIFQVYDFLHQPSVS